MPRHFAGSDESLRLVYVATKISQVVAPTTARASASSCMGRHDSVDAARPSADAAFSSDWGSRVLQGSVTKTTPSANPSNAPEEQKRNWPAAQAVDSSRAAAPEPETVEGVVTAVVAEFQQVDVESADGRSFVINNSTVGARWDRLQVGQRLVMKVLGKSTTKVVHVDLA